MSDPIDLLTPEEFWVFLRMDVQARRVALMDVAEERKPNANSRGVLVQQAGLFYEWHLNEEIDEAECYCYGTDTTLMRLESCGTLKVHRNPFRLEFWNVVYGSRGGGGSSLQRVMTKILRTMRSQARCELNVDSPGGSGLKCVLSDPIHDSVLPPQCFWRQTKDAITKKALRIEPDGGIVQKAATSPWDFCSRSVDAYTKHVFNEATKEIVSYTYTDLELSDTSLEAVRRLRIHTQPYRLEMWMAEADRRQAGEPELLEVLLLLESVLQQTSSMAPCAVATGLDISGLHEEVAAFRKEVAVALHALSEGSKALKAC